MNHRRLPDWLLSLLGLWNKTPRGLAARYADSADRSLVLKPLFDAAPQPDLPVPAPEHRLPHEDDTPGHAPASATAPDADRLRAA